MLVLVELEKAYPLDPPVLSLRAQLAFAQGDYREAIATFRGTLSRNPSRTRIRLELARALFAARDYEAARYHFEIALGQTLDKWVKENVCAFLRAIRDSKKFL